MAKKWIAKSIKHPGALRRTAKRKGAMTKGGKINMGKMSKIAAKSHSTKLKRRVNEARTLKKLRSH